MTERLSLAGHEVQRGIVQDLQSDGGTSLLQRLTSHCRLEGPSGTLASHCEQAAVPAVLGTMGDDPLDDLVRLVRRRGKRVLRCDDVVHVHHHRTRFGRKETAQRVVLFDRRQDEAATVEVHMDRRHRRVGGTVRYVHHSAGRGDGGRDGQLVGVPGVLRTTLVQRDRGVPVLQQGVQTLHHFGGGGGQRLPGEEGDDSSVRWMVRRARRFEGRSLLRNALLGRTRPRCPVGVCPG